MNHLLIPISFILLILHEIKITIGRTRKKENNNVLNPKLPTPKDLINSIILSIIVNPNILPPPNKTSVSIPKKSITLNGFDRRPYRIYFFLLSLVVKYLFIPQK